MKIKISSKNGITLCTAKTYVEEDISVLIDESLLNGPDLSNATATSNDILLGKTAYTSDGIIEGNIETYDFSTREEVYPEIDRFISGQITEYYNDRVTVLSSYAMRPISAKVEKIILPNVETLNTSIYSCSKLTYFSAPKAKKISIQEFQGCTYLVTVDIPNIEKIESNVFTGCKYLASLDFNNLTYIANSAFSNCTSFSKLILRKNNVCTLAGASPFFKDTLIASGTGFIYVPDDLLDSVYDDEGNLIRQGYRDATNWSEVASQIKPLSELEGDI